jgi:putative tricarboxylic transport membrane protein
MVKITQVSPHMLFAVLMPLIALGAYVTREFAVDIIVIAITSLLGLSVKRFGFSAPSIILGFVMGNLFERHLIRALDLYGPGLFWASPTSLIISLVIVGVIVWEPAQSLFHRMRGGKVAVGG